MSSPPAPTARFLPPGLTGNSPKRDVRGANWEKNTMRLQKNSFAAMSLAGVLAGLTGISVAQAENADMTYKAELSPLNSKTTVPTPAEKRPSLSPATS